MTPLTTAEPLVQAARDWLAVHVEYVVAALVLLFLLQSLRLALARSLAGRRMSRHRRLGAAGERRAERLLKKAGYSIGAEQASGSYRLRVDDELIAIHLRADFIVSRRGKTYIAEVKSGAISAKVSGRATRRQLLEYLLAFDADGILLVDTIEGKIRCVSFPTPK